MTRKPLLLVGASGHAHALLALLQRHGGYEPLGLIDSFQPAGRQVYGLTILGSEADVPELCVKHGSHHLLVAIGDNYQRQAMTERLRKRLADVRFPSLVDPTAVMASNAQLGAGVVVMPRAHVGAGCLLAEGSLLNTGASLDHDSSLGAFASMAPGVVTGGDVQINERSAIGLGALLTHRIRIGSDTVVGAGSLVITDLPSRIVAYGSPASVIRSRKPDEPYL